MKQLTTFIGNQEVLIRYASSLPSGYGTKEIRVGIVFDGELKEFKGFTTNMPAYDAVPEVEEDLQGFYHSLFELIEHQIIDEVSEWVEEIMNAH